MEQKIKPTYMTKSKQNILKLKEQTEYILNKYKASRNCDKALTWMVWNTFYNVTDSVSYLKFLSVPSQSNITRYRAHFQNQLYLYVPTDELIAKHRHLNIEKWRQALGYELNLGE